MNKTKYSTHSAVKVWPIWAQCCGDIQSGLCVRTLMSVCLLRGWDNFENLRFQHIIALSCEFDSRQLESGIGRPCKMSIKTVQSGANVSERQDCMLGRRKQVQ
ncbi:unnamed protein product [Ostreobium quekettii]|uniref:Uncharacterized protein n=1 Tax=Ostreobium quekettii TaxID=121088 RepID=A0A8S1IZB9_9CHLO|nr:unnamed protein product [Ostreobium quekettii]CAD7696577.1 unnamed protein product [Ostreobium quekettii]